MIEDIQTMTLEAGAEEVIGVEGGEKMELINDLWTRVWVASRVISQTI